MSRETTGPATPETPRRVRVTRSAAAPSTPRRSARRLDLAEQTGLGQVWVSDLLRAQGRLALGVIAVGIVGLGLLPVLFALVPGSAGIRVLGVPFPWLVLGGALYPAAVLLAWVHVRGSERIERQFDATIQRQ
ncbi:DUF485 domain-containing protein [Janibacter massiliensis]|uniref:hypothetical protein n=1 Tax=Janibacter massiliensis TaxID=2058291 RepID=UPI0018FEF63F|nr:hypothetical protein [Janibacter massiliensis]